NVQNTHFVVVDRSNPLVLYSSVGVFGVYKSVNGAQSWVAANQGLPNIRDAEALTLAIDPSNPAILYVGTNGGAGIFKSTNGGQTWSNIATGLGAITSLLIDPVSAST